MRITGLIFAVLLSLAAALAAQGEPLTLFVSTQGNDAWSGTLSELKPGTSEGPFASITAARDAIRAKKAAGKITGPVRVQLRGGNYFITEPIVFTPEDSGTADAPITYEAFPGEEPVLNGGRLIPNWTQEGKLWVADLPEASSGQWGFGALWVNGERRTLARTPNAAHVNGDYPVDQDFFYTDGPVMVKDPASGKEVKSSTQFRYHEGDLKPWEGLADAVVVVYHSWETSELRVKNLDEQNHVVEFTGPAAWFFGYWTGKQWYYVENLFEALDQPGEWFLNQKTGKLYYMPLPGEDMSKAVVSAPVAKQLLRMDGKPAEGKFIEHLSFQGLGMAYTDYAIEAKGHSDGQAAASVGAAVETVGARHCTFERCHIAHLGGYGLWFRTGSQDNLLSQSEVNDLGAGAVRLGESGDAGSENEVVQRNTVDNCLLHDGGRIFRGAVGAWIGRTSYNTLSHNEICDFRYTGISVGWSWGYAPTSANHNTIEFNDVHDIGKAQLNDMGGIYTLGDSPGTVIRNNYFHDIICNPKSYGGWGIYFDEGSTGILAENNVVCNTLTGTLHQHYGKENHVQNNIFAFSHREQLIRSREEEHLSFFFERNIVYFNTGSLLGSTWKNGNYRFDSNCYWDTSGMGFSFAGKPLEDWQASGQDQHSIVADPLFENAEARDFRLKADSPALKLGFQPIDMSKVGLYGDPSWTNKPKQLQREPAPFPKTPEPRHVAQDFEGVDVGQRAPEAATSEEEPAGTVRVTDETAATGKHSLKFVDAANLKNRFDPHLYFTPSLLQGTAKASFAIRVSAGAVFYHEWRDAHEPYRVGPSLWFQGDGSLVANGKALAKLPLDQWVRIRVECPLGKTAKGTYTLTIEKPGEAPQRFENIPCGSADFKRLDWFGFVSDANAAVSTYIDDIMLNAV